MPCDCEGVRLLCRLLGQIPVAPSKGVQFFTFLAGTFKRQKERLRKEGFDLAAVTDPLFFMDANSESFVALDRDLQRRIEDGQVRLT